MGSDPQVGFGTFDLGVTDSDYLATLPGAIADSVERADVARQLAAMHIGRSLVHHGLHHRRELVKDSANQPRPADQPRPANKQHPSIIAEALRKELGTNVVTVFTPGACANINSTMGGARWREGAEYLAGRAIEALRRAKRIDGPIAVGGMRQNVLVPRRDPGLQPPEAIERLAWGTGGGREDVFGPQIDHVVAMPERLLVPVNAARIGPFAIATNPGELFVEHGLAIKGRSPFPHTVVAESTNDLIMYQPTREAFEQQGYETLGGPNRVSMEGRTFVLSESVKKR